MKFALILSLCLLAGQASASQQEELENLRQRIKEMQSEIAKTSESKSEAADSLRASELAISDSNRRLAQLSEQKRDADRKLGVLEIQRQQLEQHITDQQALLEKLLYQQYLGGKHDYLKLMLDNQDPNKVARDLQYFQYIARNRAIWLDSLRRDLKELDAVAAAVHTQSETLTNLRTEQATQKEKLRQDQRDRQLVLGQISKQLLQQRKEISRLQHDENRLANLVSKIAQMLAKPKTKSLFHNTNIPDSRFDGKPFEELMGKLALPVKGEITNQFGTTRPDSTVIWKGLFISTAHGQPVRSIAAGRVVFADWLRGFGNLLIIDHGNAYMSLYGNNETLYKQVGDEIHGGDAISTVGNSGGNADSGLYFELRHESRPLDPAKWLAKK
ncbi:murein hydrolase activator EnvC family protein [Gallionella capsiferriformans]|uniref:Peptidase M23 n=1 Tax=Gallionella capsiferriformans (strain ES-2) TaxID=395494 RepID=D9SIY0_GALCS|nr:peptidoglycan DD-metalloendopeptidase family protein [Gallionella capsiferriformans]ADL54256.1 Peptidase M23 [Gallionella capsiferriformans ES-2]